MIVNIPDYVFEIWRQQKTEQEIQAIVLSLNLDAIRYISNHGNFDDKKLVLSSKDKCSKSRNIVPKAPPPNKKVPSIEEITELYKLHTLKEIGEQYDVSAEAVRKQLIKAGVARRSSTIEIDRTTLDNIVKMKKSGLSWAKITEITGYSRDVICNRLSDYGLELPRAFKPIGCDKCKEKPYARGICKSCYNRWLLRGKPKLGLDKHANS